MIPQAKPMDARGTVLIAADFIFDPWFDKIAAELTKRGYDVVRGPQQHPPAKTLFAAVDRQRLLGRADIILSTTRTLLPREILEAGPRLRGVVFPTIGTESLDFDAAEQLGLIVGHGPTPENFNSMAESTVLLMLALLYDIHGTEAVLRNDKPRPLYPTARMLMGKTIGLVGLGRIARGVADRLAPWGVRLLATSRSMNPENCPKQVQLVGLQELLRNSDIVSLHATLTDQTRHMLGKVEFSMMKPGAVLINTARGGLIDEAALCDALRTKHLFGAAIDAFEKEPLAADSELRRLKNVILTPHMIGHTHETYESIPPVVIENIERIMRGERPLFCKNPQAMTAWQARLSRLEQ